MNDDQWLSLGDWWIDELGEDPAYRDEIAPLLLDLLEPRAGARYLDVGCGEGRLMALLRQGGAVVVGCDLNRPLLGLAHLYGPVAKTQLPELGWVRPSSFDGALVGLVLEHIDDEIRFFLGVAHTVRRGGVLALVINHPIWTAPDSSPIEDPSGEMLWRPGRYFDRGYSDEPAGDGTVRFHHRSMADLLNAASQAGWDLERMEERGVSAAQVERYPEYLGQQHIPRLLGVRWKRR